ncbi:ExeM/NucH family extracellular endonuclease, partial [Dolichospermum circinale]|uniref:ExeM/NucH family extracellular endonuclease n=1 Tax=Dolichospermum circinale TaxID=109265 RepID=UPI00232A9671
MPAASYQGGTHSQNFDNLFTTVPADNIATVAATTLPTGWTFIESDPNANTFLRVHTGAVTTGDTILFGATGSNERALGSFASGSLTSIFGLELVNNTGNILTQFTLSYIGEWWRDGRSSSAVQNITAFSYGIGNTAINNGTFTSVTALNLVGPGGNQTIIPDVSLDGNSAANQTSLSSTITGISWQPGQTLWLRWSDSNDAGNDDGLAIDNVSFSASTSVPTTPTVNLSISSNTGSETGTTVITVTATASSAVSGNQTVNLGVTGTGITSGDYTLSNNIITILNGQTTGSVTFTVVDDALIEGTETATLTISSPSAGIILGNTTQNITITDNDVPVTPTVNLSVSSNAGTEAGTTIITLTATASSAVSGNQTVNLGVSGTGITASDYYLTKPTITIPNGQTSGSVSFIVADDAIAEGTETATLTISTPSAGISLGVTTSQNITITNNDTSVLTKVGGATSVNGAEIPAFDPVSKQLFVVAGNIIEFYTVSNTGTLALAGSLTPTITPPAGTGLIPNSVAVKNGVVAVAYAVQNTTTLAQLTGKVAFFNAANGSFINAVDVGALPDMLTFTPDGTKVLVANEGEPNSYGQANSVDPEGSVSIINIAGGVASATVQTADFTSFNSQIASLKASGVRIIGPGSTVAQDVEPEYIAVAPDGLTARITLQENNAIAILDIATATITQIIPLGVKDYSLPGNGIDASDQDGGINITNWPVVGLYQPDAIASFSINGQAYYITANEGDSRAYTGFNEEIRVNNASYVLDPIAFPNASTLKQNANLGRLQLTNATGDTDGDGDIDRIESFGARSFSIWNSNGTQVFDSGDQLEQITATRVPTLFNSDGTTTSFDSRSDNKGPEPEGVVVGVINGRTYAFIGLERTGDVIVYDASNPNQPKFIQYINTPEDLAVEGLTFISAADSPTGKPLLVTANEVSKTVAVFEIKPPTYISDIQGTGSTFNTAFGGTQTIEGIVTRAFLGATKLNGFYVQEEDADGDGNSATSEAIFVYDPSGKFTGNVGDKVRITGTVAEFTSGTSSLTQLTSLTNVTNLGASALPTITNIQLPVTSVTDLERYEGMLVNLSAGSGNLTVTENFQLGRFGQVVLAADGSSNQAGTDARLDQYTQFNAPSVSGYAAYQAEIAKRKIYLDDGSSSQNLDPTIFGRGGNPLSASNTLRSGDTVTNITGILDQRFEGYRIQTSTGVNFTPSNARPDTPPAVGGTLKVASFNVLNYFNGNGTGGGFPTPRGANNVTEFNRQRDKIIQAIINSGADVMGLMEIENDGYGSTSAIQDLINGLNAIAGAGTYAFINPDASLGSDAIAVGLIYKSSQVTPVSAAATMTNGYGTGAFDLVGRKPLAQTFQQISTGELFTAVVNHFKSKGSSSGGVGDADAGDGQGLSNGTRTRQAQDLAAWLATKPTGTNDADYLLLGDFNAYAQEDPITTLASAGYGNLLPNTSYSYVFDGQVGALDHALGSNSLATQVTGAEKWHINADEPTVLDYNTEFKSAGQIISLYNADQFRASDHDPVLVGLNLNSAPSNVTLSATSTNENVTANSLVGTFSTTDPTIGDTFTYSFVPGTNDNVAFTISGNQLLINASPNFEAKSSYSVVVRSTDQSGLYTDKTFSITINDVNDLASISGTAAVSIKEGTNVNANGKLTASGLLTVSDEDAGQNKFSTTVVSANGNLGSLTITDTGAFSYSVDNSTVQYLVAGQTKVDTFTVTSLDGTASQNISITINGVTAGFTGVAAGDATSNSVILWTRTFDTATPSQSSGVTENVKLEISTDLGFGNIVQSINSITRGANYDYTLKINATGLQSNTKYYYRFQAATGELSQVGTFKTIPNPTVAASVKFAFSGDIDGLMRPYPLASAVPGENLDFYVNLGDVIYENASNVAGNNGASWLNSPSVTLSNDALNFNGIPRAFIPGGTPFATQAQLKADYEKKYRENFLPVNNGGQNSLQVFYAGQGNYTTWDNHELGNRKYIDGGAPAGGSVGGATGTNMLTGRGVDARAYTGSNTGGSGNVNNVNDAADLLSPTDLADLGGFMNQSTGFQTLRDVFLNYQPIAERTVIAPSDPRSNGTKQLYSAVQWGKNALYINTDSRSYRDIRLKTATGGADDTGSRADNPDRTYLGDTQLAWLKQTLLDAQTAGTPWKFVSLSDPIDQLGPIGGTLSGTLTYVNSDGGKSYMGGYRAERNDLLKFIADNGIKNVVFLSADDHQNRINELYYSPTGQTGVQSSYVKVPYVFSIVDGPLGATGPDAITDHSFANIKAIADDLATKQADKGIEPIGLNGYAGLHDVKRDQDGTLVSKATPGAVDFYSPDTFNYSVLEVSPDGNTLTVTSKGINSTAQNSATEYDASGNPVRTLFSFQVDAAVAPTNLALSSTNVNENVAANTVIGTFTTTDPSATDTFTYSLVSGTGGADNSAFTISGNQLQINASPDFETKSSYSILVRTTDNIGLTFDKALTINVNDLNEAPTNLALSATNVNENIAANSVIGTFSSTDPDTGNTFTYSLVNGTGATDNSAFTISGNQLQINASPDLETKSSYNIRVRTTDNIGLTFDKALTINVNDLNEIFGTTGNNNLVGTANNDYIDGKAGNDTLNGGAGVDTLIGGTGNDTYIVDTATDTIIENLNEGTDLVQSSVTYTLSNNLENLTLTGTALNGTGNILNNTITGNTGNNILDGGAGNDTLIGGLGDDTYVVDSTGDVITEAASQGTDLVQSSITYTLTGNVENLTLTGTAINGTGNTLDNTITGNSGNNTLNGGTGKDTLIGGLGNDTLIGGAGNDSLVGGTGNDTYLFSITTTSLGTDTITEAAVDGGQDTIDFTGTTAVIRLNLGITTAQTLVANGSKLTLTAANAIENVIAGAGADRVIGNDLDNRLVGRAGNDALTGGAGNDTLVGGAGNDILTGGTGNDFFGFEGNAAFTVASQGLDTIQDFTPGNDQISLS